MVATRAASLSEQESRIIADFGRHYGISFQRPELLKLALTHRSYLSVTGQGPRESNERLEFLGDSVLGLATSEYLYRERPTEHEGQLTKTKSLLVSKAILSRRALAMGLGRYVLMSHSEVESGGRQRLSILADAFEAVVGAIYLDQGLDAARQFISRWLLRDTREIVADKRHTNFKSHLQEFVQSTYRTHPVYRIRSEMGPDHSKQFNVEVMVGRRVLGSGKGRNKKEAEQAAAKNALEQVEGPQEERVARERRPAPSPAPEVEATAPGRAIAAGEGRRRRGRRGGRGRGGRGEAHAGMPQAPVPAPGPVTEAHAPSRPGPAPPRAAVERPERPARPERPERAERLERPERPVAVPEPPEVEPIPPAYFEEDLEEVGRPEGPHGEWQVDPYAVEPPRASSPRDVGEADPSIESPPRRDDSEREDLAESPAREGHDAIGPVGEGESESDDSEAEPGRSASEQVTERTEPKPPSQPGVVYGRRQGRERWGGRR